MAILVTIWEAAGHPWSARLKAMLPFWLPWARCLYGRTKPGTLLKHHILVRTEHWDVTDPGFTEMDLVSHSGNWADGEFLQSLNLTDLHTGWVESHAVLGKGQRVVGALRRDGVSVRWA